MPSKEAEEDWLRFREDPSYQGGDRKSRRSDDPLVTISAHIYSNIKDIEKGFFFLWLGF